MNYELAKELKEAGFKCVLLDDGRLVDHNHKVIGLEELIEALGAVNFILARTQYNTPPKWEAQVYNTQTRTFQEGSTPQIAVARLWLALNSKLTQ